MADLIDETIEILEKEHDYIEAEFNYLNELKQILSVSEKKLLAIENEAVLKSAEKSLQRKSKRLARKAGRIENRTERLKNRLLTQLNKFPTFLPSTYKTTFPLATFIKEITLYSAVLLKAVSRRAGEIPKLIKEYGMDRVELRGKVEQAIDKGVAPLVQVIENILAYLRREAANIRKDIGIEETFFFDMGTQMLKLGGIRPGSAEILIDTSFAREVADEKSKRGKRFYDLGLPIGRILIADKIESEMRRKVPRDMRAYLTDVLGAKVVGVEPISKVEADEVVNLWRQKGKGKGATASKESDFRRSGEMRILVYCLRKIRRSIVSAPSTTVVLCNDGDAIGTIKNWRAVFRKSNIFVFSFIKSKFSLETIA